MWHSVAQSSAEHSKYQKSLLDRQIVFLVQVKNAGDAEMLLPVL